MLFIWMMQKIGHWKVQRNEAERSEMLETGWKTVDSLKFQELKSIALIWIKPTMRMFVWMRSIQDEMKKRLREEVKI